MFERQQVTGWDLVDSAGDTAYQTPVMAQSTHIHRTEGTWLLCCQWPLGLSVELFEWLVPWDQLSIQPQCFRCHIYMVSWSYSYHWLQLARVNIFAKTAFSDVTLVLQINRTGSIYTMEIYRYKMSRFPFYSFHFRYTSTKTLNVAQPYIFNCEEYASWDFLEIYVISWVVPGVFCNQVQKQPQDLGGRPCHYKSATIKYWTWQ